MTSFKLILFIIVTINILIIDGAISDKRLCANEDCTKPISKAKTLLRYGASEKGMLSFPGNVEITIYSKSAGSNVHLWGAEYDGKRGYVPIAHVKEIEVFIKEPNFLTNTEFATNVPSEKTIETNEINPDKPEPLVIDGTTVYSPEDISSSSVTDLPNLSTVVPDIVQPVENVPKQQEQTKTDAEEKIKISNESHEHNTMEENSTTKPEQNSEIKKDQLDLPQVTPKVELNEDKLPATNLSNVDESKLNEISPPQINTENIAGLERSPDNIKIEKPQFLEEDSNLLKSQIVENEAAINSNDEEEDEEEDDDDDEDDDNEELLFNGEEGDIEEVFVKGSTFNENTPEQIQKESQTSQKSENDLNETLTFEPIKTESQSTENKENVEIPLDNKNDPVIKDTEIPVVPLQEKTEEIKKSEETHGFFDMFSSTIEKIANTVNEVEEATNNVAQNEINQDDLPENNETNGPPSIEEILTTPSQLEEMIIPTDQPNISAPPDIFEQTNIYESPNIPEATTEYANLQDTNFQDAQEYLNDENLKFQNTVGGENEETTPYYENIATEEQTPPSVESVLNEEITSSQESEIQLPSIPEEPNSSEASMEDNENQSGFFSGILNYFGSNNPDVIEDPIYAEKNNDVLLSNVQDPAKFLNPSSPQCSKDINMEKLNENLEDTQTWNIGLQDLLILLGITAVTVVVFLWGYMIIDKSRKEAPLIAKINNLEKLLLVSTKENQLLTDKITDLQNESHDQVDTVTNSTIEELKMELEQLTEIKITLEEQVQTLEKELENSTEVGLELNRMLSDVLSSQNGSDTLMANIEQLQKQLVEQQSTINTVNARLNEKDTENHELQLELEINNKKVIDLQQELDKMVLNILKIEEEKEQVQFKNENEITELKMKFEKLQSSSLTDRNKLVNEINELKKKLNESQRNLELKINEYNLLKDSVSADKNDSESFKTLIDTNSLKAEMQQLKRDNHLLSEHLQQDQQVINNFESRVNEMSKEMETFKLKFEEADKEKLEAFTKLEVLNAYFKEKEAEMQKELSKHQTMWMEKQGEATSTIERIKFMQEEVQSFKAQNASLKQEIVAQEVDLKSQISVLEKKAHENWVTARQAERKLEDARQEAAQLRNRLTLRERNFIEEKSLNRLQSPLEPNGDTSLSPLHMNAETSASPPLLYGRENLTTSPPLPGMLPFLPPPPGAPFMPPPMHGMPPFMPPPPTMYPGDHRPPPLGGMSSPPISRYSPDSRIYSPYDRNSPSPTDDEYYHYSYGRRDNRDYVRPPPHRSSMRNNKDTTMSSGSGHSNDSLDKINKNNTKV